MGGGGAVKQMRKWRLLVAIVWCIALVAMLSLIAGCSHGATSDLADYIEREDDSFAVRKQGSHEGDAVAVHAYTLTSQTWRGIDWHHWLTVFEPKEIRHRDTALLLIAGGQSGASSPDLESAAGRLAAVLAEELGAVTAVVEQIPNQPLFGDLTEDALIAYTFDQFLATGEGDWPLLLPMAKAAVRAMDAVRRIANDELGCAVDGFLVTGASKRGWTTWLSAAADPRVKAIAPLVIDVLNMAPQMKRQLRSYGDYSEQLGDYTERRIQDRVSSAAGERLRRIVDPFSYRARLTMPKLVVLGTNDPYWTVDAADAYFSDLSGENYLYYSPNTGHDVDAGGVRTMTAFFRAALAGTPMPSCSWERTGNGGLRVTWSDPGARARLWKAYAPSRDFREAEWRSEELQAKAECLVQVETPKTGWVAFFVEVVHQRPDAGFGLCSTITVLPDTFPYEP